MSLSLPSKESSTRKGELEYLRLCSSKAFTLLHTHLASLEVIIQ